MPELADDDVLRSDMLEAETDAHEFLRMLERRRQEAEHLTEAIAANITVLARAGSHGAARRRNARTDAQGDGVADLRKVELADATICVRNGARRSSSTTRRRSRTSTAT